MISWPRDEDRGGGHDVAPGSGAGDSGQAAALDRAGPGSTIWYVVAVQYRGGNEGRCDAVLRSLSAARPGVRQLVEANDKFPEFMGLFEFPAR